MTLSRLFIIGNVTWPFVFVYLHDVRIMGHIGVRLSLRNSCGFLTVLVDMMTAPCQDLGYDL